jgi:F-type H+-transporting ATPase subunit gamma
MANFREFNVRLNTLGGMRRVTSTMKMVASSHLHRSQNELLLPAPFNKELRKLTALVSQLPVSQKHRLCTPPLDPAKLLLIVMSSDRGLCGAFNGLLAQEVRGWVAEQRAERECAVDLIYVGRKAHSALHRELPPCMEVFRLSAHPSFQETAPISTYAMDKFLDGTYSEVWITGSRFVNTLKHDPETRRILPVEREAECKRDESMEEETPILEPAVDQVLEGVIRLLIHYQVLLAQLHRAASEQASRVIAMENATTNLRVMEKDLTLRRNRARQATITNELTEIVSGAETLA